MAETAEELEGRITRLRAAVREAVLAGDRGRSSTLRRELRQAEQFWEDALAEAEHVATVSSQEPEPAPGIALSSLLPLREQVHEALSLLTVPAAPRLIATVHEAFFATTFPTVRLTSLKRDEERSFRSAPFARPYYICAALTADLLAPSRGLLAISTWPLERRVIGSLSPRVDFLISAVKVAEAIERLPAQVPAAQRLLWRFAASIPGAAESAANARAHQVTQAALAELTVHQATDQAARQAAARRAGKSLDEAQQLFGTRLRVTGRARWAGA